MIKIQPARQRDYSYTDISTTSGTHYAQTSQFANGENKIDYSTDRTKIGKWPWQRCVHTCKDNWDGKFAVDFSCTAQNSSQSDTLVFKNKEAYSVPPERLGADPGWNASVMQGIMSQLDLNKGESCLMYANVIQALPFLGGALKMTSILNQAAKRLSKSFRRKPFTTVVKSLISLDFVDRFVISPTIDDARKFATACNYVRNKLDTAEERNSHRFALESELESVFKDKESTFSIGQKSFGNGWSGIGHHRYRTRSVDKAFMLLEATYSTDALTPFRLWANRTGFTRPLDSVWDLVPFSFVIDYFFRTGDFISALSDEMSTDEGLRGTITKIHGCWGSHLYESSVETWADGISFAGGSRYPRILSRECLTNKTFVRTSTYKRFPVPDPWPYLLSLEERLNEYLTVTVIPSSTRLRTIAELIIQAKL